MTSSNKFHDSEEYIETSKIAAKAGLDDFGIPTVENIPTERWIQSGDVKIEFDQAFVNEADGHTTMYFINEKENQLVLQVKMPTAELKLLTDKKPRRKGRKTPWFC